MAKPTFYDVAVIGCGSVGLASAYYLARDHGITNIALIDCGQPMAFTSAQSGENYRNWWPHPSMVAFTNRSIDLLEEFSLAGSNRINMTRRGYALATRQSDIDELVQQLHYGLGDQAEKLLRYHESARAPGYKPATNADWKAAENGVDILRNADLVKSVFPSYAEDIQSVIHIRRGGDISAQQLGTSMLEALSRQGARRISGTVTGIKHDSDFTIEVDNEGIASLVTAGKIVNAAGPFAGAVAGMLDLSLPVFNTFQQKIAFQDKHNTVPRGLPFSIDLDGQSIDWLEDERKLLLEDPEVSWLAQPMPGSIHCRPDGGDSGSWVKLGWAYNETAVAASRDLPLDDNFPDIVLRGAARLNPALKAYYGKLPRAMHHYGGWYTMTKENWPLIGPMDITNKVQGAYINGAMSGFGTMAACAAGELCAAWVAGAELPAYAPEFSIKRYEDATLMRLLESLNRGVL